MSDISTTTVPARRHADLTDVSTPHVDADIANLAASKLSALATAVAAAETAAVLKARIEAAADAAKLSKDALMAAAGIAPAQLTAAYPRGFAIIPEDDFYTATIIQGTWSRAYRGATATYWHDYELAVTAALNDEINFPLECDAGTYTMTIREIDQTSSGTWAYSIDAAAAFYTVASANRSDNTLTVTGIAITAGPHLLKLKCTSAASAGHLWHQIAFVRTGA